MKRIFLAGLACFLFACGPDDSQLPAKAERSSYLMDAYGKAAPSCAKKCPHATGTFSCVKGRCSGITSCAAGYVPSSNGSTCVACSEGTAACGTECVNLDADPNNCNSCCTVCPGDPNGVAQCSAGACVIVCNAGYSWSTEFESCVLSGGCTSASDCNDNEVCTFDTCVAGVCQHSQRTNCCHADAECTSTQFCSSYYCKAKFPNGNSCGGNNMCISGWCSEVSPRYCTATLPNGDPCTANYQCTSGSCVDGYCE